MRKGLVIHTIGATLGVTIGVEAIVVTSVTFGVTIAEVAFGVKSVTLGVAVGVTIGVLAMAVNGVTFEVSNGKKKKSLCPKNYKNIEKFRIPFGPLQYVNVKFDLHWYELAAPFDLYMKLPNNKHFFSMIGIEKIRKINGTESYG